MKIVKRIIVALCIMALLVPFVSTQKTEAKSKINKTSASIQVGKTVTLKVTGAKNVKWSSSNKAIASVSSRGKVKGIKAGTCIITGKINSVKYKCKVRVKESSDIKKLKNIYDKMCTFTTSLLYFGWTSSTPTSELQKCKRNVISVSSNFSDYDDYITNLSGSKYSKIKSSWSKVYDEWLNNADDINNFDPINPTTLKLSKLNAYNSSLISALVKVI